MFNATNDLSLAIRGAYQSAEDPESAALWYDDVTKAELRRGLKKAKLAFPGEEDCEWWEDFASAVEWYREHPAERSKLIRGVRDDLVSKNTGLLGLFI